ncbi:MAG: cysteine synthase family protein [Bacilli bacterium]
MIYNSIVEMVGNTPLLRLHKIEKHYHIPCQIYAKVEKTNPAGSIKDRAVLEMLKEYSAKGLINKDTMIIEPTSGNTGIALCAFANYFDFKAVIVMPSSMSEQRKALMKDYNGTLVLVDGGMKEAVKEANRLHQENKNSIILGQFDNEDNLKAHYLYTAKEIYDDISDLSYVFAGIGTGGTISGIGKYFKKHHPQTKIIGIEPASSPLISKGISGPHEIQGIGANFIPKNYKKEFVDSVITVTNEEAIDTAKEIVKEEGLLVGISSGAALIGAINTIKTLGLKDIKVVVIFPDTGERYSWN